MSSTTLRLVDGDTRLVMAENTGEAARQASIASLAANSASAAGNYFPSQAAGEAGSTTGQFFSHPDGAGGLVYRERTGGGSTIIAQAATKAQVDAKADSMAVEGNTPYKKSAGSFAGYLQNDDPVWIGGGTYNGSFDPAVVVSRELGPGDVSASPHMFSANFVSSFGGGLSQNTFDDRSKITGGAMNHHATYQSGLTLSGDTDLTTFFHSVMQFTMDGATANLSNAYGLFVQPPVEANGGDFTGRIVGLLFNGIPRDYGNIADPNYVIYSNGLAPAYMAGQFTSGHLLASDSEGTVTAQITARTPDGTACGVQIHQTGQNWWEWRIPASQTYLSLYESVGGGSGTERLRVTTGGALTPAADNTQDLGTAALSWRGVYADTGFYVGGNKVLGAQGAAVADATDAATAITQLNALLARMRAHGLIAT